MGDVLPKDLAMKEANRIRRPSVRYVTLYFLLGGLGTLVAGLVGTLIIFGLGGMISLSVAVFLFPLTLQIIFSGTVQGMLWALPLNFFLLPITAALLRRPVVRDLILPVVGLGGGAATIWVWLRITGDWGRPSSSLLLVVGSIAGAVSGLFYARALNELDR
jgi:hypothetical protein